MSALIEKVYASIFFFHGISSESLRKGNKSNRIASTPSQFPEVSRPPNPPFSKIQSRKRPPDDSEISHGNYPREARGITR
ncbi:hypothetical protein CDAR_46101, partial [Caerostris darwini]